MKRLLIVVIAAAALFPLYLGAEDGMNLGFGRGDSFSRADSDRDGSICWKEYRDFRRGGSRGDFYRRDRNRDNRLSRDEWGPFGERNNRWPPRR